MVCGRGSSAPRVSARACSSPREGPGPQKSKHRGVILSLLRPGSCSSSLLPLFHRPKQVMRTNPILVGSPVLWGPKGSEYLLISHYAPDFQFISGCAKDAKSQTENHYVNIQEQDTWDQVSWRRDPIVTMYPNMVDQPRSSLWWTYSDAFFQARVFRCRGTFRGLFTLTWSVRWVLATKCQLRDVP